MKKHDRLMNALAEIKEVCLRNEDSESGCGKKCPFLTGEDGDYFRDCEIMQYVHTYFYSPDAWGEENE